jgi:aryl-alcohol dehydrogenase-like predicted oxidoreductase
MERRDFIRSAALGAAAMVGGAVSAPEGTSAAPANDESLGVLETFNEGGMKFRMLGETGKRVSLIGLGGYHLAKPGPKKPSNEEAIRIVRAGIDAGINFCDNSWDYNGGESEERMGRALRDGYRQRVVLMTKLDGHTAAAAMAQLETSLRRLQTDHIDLIQFHEIIRMDDPERIFAAGGALEAMVRAREQGKVSFIGFTGHKSPAIHHHMFEVAAQHGFHFDTVQMPVNIMDAHYDSFQHTIFPVARQQRTAVLAMKTFGDQFILDSHVAEPIEMLHYSMSQPVAVVITGCDQMPILEQALQAVRSFQPMPVAQQQALLVRSAQAAQGGHIERYKTTHEFDGTIQNPQWLTET